MYHTLLTSKQTTSVHLDDLNGSAAKTRFQNIALADAEWLPSEQNESGLLMLRHAWSCADILEYDALRYKHFAKFLNVLILALGVFITIFTIIGGNGVLSKDLVKGQPLHHPLPPLLLLLLIHGLRDDTTLGRGRGGEEE